MNLKQIFEQAPTLLMEGAIIERLKREYQVNLHKDLDLAGLIYDEKVLTAMTTLFDEYIQIAEIYQFPFLMTTPTRRANKDRIERSEYSSDLIKENVHALKKMTLNRKTPIFLGGLMGCKGDAYLGTHVLNVKDAVAFHSWQANILCEAGIDFLYAGIMPVLTESIGMARAMEATGLPYIISFMIKADGRLIDGTSIHDAISAIDHETDRKPLCYMTNCVHPSILSKALSHSFNQTELIKKRFKGIQANAAALSLDELDGSDLLKSSAPEQLTEDMMALYDYINPKIFGGCCGTDKSHMESIAKALNNLNK